MMDDSQKDLVRAMQIVEQFERRLKIVEDALRIALDRVRDLERNKSLQEPSRYQVVDARSKQ